MNEQAYPIALADAVEDARADVEGVAAVMLALADTRDDFDVKHIGVLAGVLMRVADNLGELAARW